MRHYFWIGILGLLFVSCLREGEKNDCSIELFFNMQDVAYTFAGSEVAYQPYYIFTEHLDLFLFSESQLYASNRYDNEYCRTHPTIPFYANQNPQFYLFTANLSDPKMLNYSFIDGQLNAVFSILNNEEPPVLLTAVSRFKSQCDSMLVNLRILTSYLEIQLIHPPTWIYGFDMTVTNIATSISANLNLEDTTHIYKRFLVNHRGVESYTFGMNTFPTHPNEAALLKIDLIGLNEVYPIAVNDERLYLLSGVIARLNIKFENENKITISVEIDGKWEVVDGGHIII
ncbi:MAG: hypothetical protein RSA98_03245 [Odoribacter sp.]